MESGLERCCVFLLLFDNNKVVLLLTPPLLDSCKVPKREEDKRCFETWTLGLCLTVILPEYCHRDMQHSMYTQTNQCRCHILPFHLALLGIIRIWTQEAEAANSSVFYYARKGEYWCGCRLAFRHSRDYDLVDLWAGFK